jgi:hypothetical protein
MMEIETRYRKIYHVSDDERAALERGAEDVRDGRFANDGQVSEVFSRNGCGSGLLNEYDLQHGYLSYRRVDAYTAA